MIKKILPNVLFVAGLSYAQTLPSSAENYIYTKTYLSDPADPNLKIMENIQYIDGLGRPIQTVDVKSTPLGKDVVSHIEYDIFGRQTRDYFSVPQAGTSNGAIYANPLANSSTIYGGERIYSEKILEASPLNRLQQEMQPGNDWAGKPKIFAFAANATGDKVRKFSAMTTWDNGATKSVLGDSGLYSDGQLYKDTVTDEDGNSSIEFKNGRGQVLLTRKIVSATENADTYYVYNDLDQLIYIIPPLLSKLQTWTTADLEHLVYEYRYDKKNRNVEKKLPGKGWEYMVYDKADRLILTQDASLRVKGQWLFTKYDQFSRPIYTGILDSPSGRLAQVNAIESLLSNIETRSTSSWNNSGMDVFYTNNTAYPVTNFKLLSVNYYDTYPQGAPPVQGKILDQSILPQAELGNSSTTKGFLLASYVKNIEDDNWTKTYSYYDMKGQVIGVHSINHLGGYNKTESKLDFTGIPQIVVTKHKRLNADTEKVIRETFEYDSQNRLKKHWHQVDNNPQELLAENTYNELSQLVNKKVGNNLQSIDYAYNIRGWMTRINDPANLNGKLFGFELKYQNPTNSLGGTGKYNGSITEADWKTSQDGVFKRYNYQYDIQNRLVKGIYSEPGTTVEQNGYFNEDVGYDLNGNIIALKRFTKPYKGITPELIDNLQYQYENLNQSNKLEKVTVANGAPDNPLGYYAQGNKILYNENGSITEMKDKGRSRIDYNFLNLPDYFDGDGFDYAKYLYTAEGEKVKKTEWYAFGNKSTETDYLDDFQYINGSLKFVPTSEGYYDYEKGAYVYNYTDHLGNIRLSYLKKAGSPNIEVLGENNYYPFGLKHVAGSTKIPYYYGYEYNGKESQNLAGNMYDYGARMYMPDLGRWGAVDELSEKFNTNSHYSYVVNDPINGYDPDGRDVIFVADSKAVPVAGHGAVIIGNKKDGWYYYSMNGTGKGSKPYGDAKNADVGTFLGVGLSPKQAMLTANRANKNETHHYDKFKTVKTSKAEDKMLRKTATSSSSAKKYCVIGQSCATVMLDTFNKLIDIRTDNAWYVPHQINPAPNPIVDNLERGANYYNRFFISTERQLEIRKVGKLVVGPVIDSKGIEHY